MRLAISAIALLYFGLMNVARADYMDYHFRVECDADANRAEIAPYAVWNTDVYSSDPQECALSNGRIIRAKMGLGPVFPYGQGGADPSKWLSVWVDSALALSRVPFGCGDEGPCSLRVIVTPMGLDVCSPETPDPLAQEEPGIEPKEVCNFTPNDELSSTRDTLEYPMPNERIRPAAGSLVRLYSRDEQLCSQFQLLAEPRGRSSVGDNIRPRLGLPKDAESIEPSTSSPHEFSGRYHHYDFDINNDGKNDTVVGLHARTHYRDGDIYFFYADSKIPTTRIEPLGSSRSESAFAAAADRIIPHFWSDYAGKDEKELAEKNSDDGAYEIKSVGAPWWDDGDNPVFRFRYWYLWPFRYEQSTYFLTWSMEGDKQHWYTILRPDISHQVVEMCIFQVARERY